MTSKIRVKYKIWSMSCAFGVYQISPNIFKMLKLVIELSNYIKKSIIPNKENEYENHSSKCSDTSHGCLKRPLG